MMSQRRWDEKRQGRRSSERAVVFRLGDDGFAGLGNFGQSWCDRRARITQSTFYHMKPLSSVSLSCYM